MKLLRVPFFLLFFVGYILQANASRFGHAYPKGKEQAIEQSLKSKKINNYNAQNILREAKYHIIRGNLDYAKVLLRESSISVNFTKPVQFRYLALINFIEGNYKQVVDILSKSELQNHKTLPKVCFLNVLSLIIVNRPEKAKIEWRKCRKVTDIYSTSELAWMQIIVDLKTKKDQNYINSLFENLAIDTVDKRQLRIYLKLAMYLNMQHKIIPRFKYFGASPFEDITQRELIGLNYYRNGNITRAYELLENLETANSEVFKGNLYLSQKNYTMAYAQYKLALKRKANSRNALNRLLPLSWKLNQWQEGIKYLQSIEVEEEDRIENNTLMAVYLTLLDKPKAVNHYLRKVTKLTNSAESIEVSQLKVLNGIHLNEYNDVENAAANSCTGRDGLNCWLLIFMNSWDEITDRFNKPESVHAKLADLHKYYTQDMIPTEIKEDILVDQKRIEELDNNLIILK